MSLKYEPASMQDRAMEPPAEDPVSARRGAGGKGWREGRGGGAALAEDGAAALEDGGDEFSRIGEMISAIYRCRDAGELLQLVEQHCDSWETVQVRSPFTCVFSFLDTLFYFSSFLDALFGFLDTQPSFLDTLSSILYTLFCVLDTLSPGLTLRFDDALDALDSDRRHFQPLSRH